MLNLISSSQPPTFYGREISVGFALSEPSSVLQDTCEAGRVARSSLLLQSSSFCLITKTFWSVHMHCIPLSPSFCNTHGEVLEPPSDEVRGALSPAPWLFSERSLQNRKYCNCPFGRQVEAAPRFRWRKTERCFCVNTAVSCQCHTLFLLSVFIIIISALRRNKLIYTTPCE